MSVGKRIASLRESRSLSQSQLAKKLNISTSTLGMYETDKRNPNTEMLKLLASFFHVTTDYLLEITPSKNSKDHNSIDIADDKVLMTYQGKPLSKEDREMMLRIMRGKE